MKYFKPVGHAPAVFVSQMVLLQPFFKTKFPLSWRTNVSARPSSSAFQIIFDWWYSVKELFIALSKARLKPSESKYNATLLEKPFVQKVIEPQLRCNPKRRKSSRYFPFLDCKNFPSSKRPFRVHVSFWQFPKEFCNYV